VSLPSMGAGRWRSRRLRLAAAVIAVALLALACGRATDEARAVADQALERIDGLEARVAELEDALDIARGRLKDARDFEDRVSRDIDSLGRRLVRSVANVRASITDVRAAASEGAAGALAEAQQVARDLAILEQRYDYHLRRYHGGGG
jgi:outer membrane murein-binding lipoprotein Lpp